MKIEKRTNIYGTIRWYKPGTDILHREDGPAIEYSNGTKEYWFNGGLYFYNDWLCLAKPKLKLFF